jgi:hypothetical protein
MTLVWGDPSTYATHCNRCGEQLSSSPRPLYLFWDGEEVCRHCYYSGLADITEEHARQFRPWQRAYWRWRQRNRLYREEADG